MRTANLVTAALLFLATAREPKSIERVWARLEALARANAAPRCRAWSKRTGQNPAEGQPLPHGRCKVHGEHSDRFAVPHNDPPNVLAFKVPGGYV
jgi:hypothetical protein